jgi:acetyl/propionyl-CoA carboxylase alpha subunit
MPLERVTFAAGEEEIEVRYEALRDGRLRILIDENEHLVTDYASGEGSLELEINGSRISLSIVSDTDLWFVHGPGGDYELCEQPRFPLPGAGGANGGLTAPMPGSVISTSVKVGDQVEKGQILLILEAMKMEHQIAAPRDGVVKEVHVSQGEQVTNGALLVVLEDED